MYSSFTSQKNTPHFFDIEMKVCNLYIHHTDDLLIFFYKIQILLCLCIGKALAFLANEVSIDLK